MAELTQAQVDRAAEEFYPHVEVIVGRSSSLREEDRIRLGLRAAAPFLQFPLDAITDEESGRYPWSHRGSIENFIRRRNAALLPKPVDPRRAVIQKAIDESGSMVGGKTVDMILAALDEVK